MGIKIAVYTIALNEEKHVKRWFDSAKDADLLLIADTGSTDSTKFIAKSLGIQVYEIEVNPWRFDVARNASLSLIPENFDMCVQLDMDEVLSSNWRAQVEKAFLHGNLWPTYKHVTVRNQAGDPRNFQLYFKIHPRNGFKWEYPIHEILTPTDKTQKYTREFISLEVDHLQDNSKSRKSYLGLLQTAVSESPNDWRMNHYLNREYFYVRDWLKVLQTGYKCSALPGGWNVERASTYMWMSEAARWLELMPLAKYWAERATDSAPEFYEAWHWRAHIAHLLNDWTECLESAQKIEILSRQSHHLVKPEVWEWWGYDLIALSSHKLGLDSQAVLFGEKAFFANPGDERLKKNLDFYRKELPYKKDSTFHLNLSQKLIDFPKMRVISLPDAIDRKRKFIIELSKAPNIDFVWIEAIKSDSGEYQDIQNSLLKSHLKALEDFIKSDSEEWTVIAEDDLQLNLVENWPFTWNQKFSHLNFHKIGLLQMCLITKIEKDLDTELHPRKNWIDWSSACYLINKFTAKQIVGKKMNPKEPVEQNLFSGLLVYSEALFACDYSNLDSFHADHLQTLHKKSFEKALLDMKMRALE